MDQIQFFQLLPPLGVEEQVGLMILPVIPAVLVGEEQESTQDLSPVAQVTLLPLVLLKVIRVELVNLFLLEVAVAALVVLVLMEAPVVLVMVVRELLTLLQALLLLVLVAVEVPLLIRDQVAQEVEEMDKEDL